MNVNQLLKQCLKPVGLPVEPDPYTGEADEYISFIYADERPVISGDDVNVLDLTTMYIHCYTRKNPQLYKKQIRRGLRLGGFTILSTSENFDNKNGFNHIMVTAEIEGVIDNDELPDEQEDY